MPKNAAITVFCGNNIAKFIDIHKGTLQLSGHTPTDPTAAEEIENSK